MERRRKRESFSKTLGKIATRIAAHDSITVNWRSWYYGDQRTARLSVEKLWVVGSYARGALECGDLDLVLEYTLLDGKHPDTPALSRVAIGAPADVRLYTGTPNDNTSGVAFEEARLVWSKAEPDWHANLQTIVPDPEAKRYSRITDEVPLRGEQVRQYNEDILETVAKLTRSKALQWQWFPLQDIEVDQSKWNESAQDYAKRWHWYGAKARKLLPFLVELLQAQSFDDEASFVDAPGEVVYGGIVASFGRPYIDLERLDDVGYSAIAIAPHISARGPNGIWLITRGENHRLAKKLRHSGAYLLEEIIDNKPKPLTFYTIDGLKEARVLELFTTKSAAKAALRLERQCFPEREFDIRYTDGAKLLPIIPALDCIDVECKVIPFTATGAEFLNKPWDYSPKSKLAELASALPRLRQITA